MTHTSSILNQPAPEGTEEYTSLNRSGILGQWSPASSTGRNDLWRAWSRTSYQTFRPAGQARWGGVSYRPHASVSGWNQPRSGDSA